MRKAKLTADIKAKNIRGGEDTVEEFLATMLT
jgi:aspartokinase-like uncharacterized kinase